MPEFSQRQAISERVKDLTELLVSGKISQEQFEREVAKLKRAENRVNQFLNQKPITQPTVSTPAPVQYYAYESPKEIHKQRSAVNIKPQPIKVGFQRALKPEEQHHPLQEKIPEKPKEKTLQDIYFEDKYSVQDFLRGFFYIYADWKYEKENKTSSKKYDSMVVEKKRIMEEIKSAGKLYMEKKMSQDQFKFFVKFRQKQLDKIEKYLNEEWEGKRFEKIYSDVKKGWGELK